MSTKVYNQEEVKFTSDWHLFHEMLIKNGHRHFHSIDHMHRVIKSRIVDCAVPTKTLFMLGDVSFAGGEKTAEFISQIDCDIILLRGNHDKKLPKATANCFTDIVDYLEIDVRDDDANGGKQRIVMSHFPFRSWNRHHYGSWHLHGHCHGNLEPLGKSLDVGVDTFGFHPYSYLAVKRILDNREIHKCDHHELKGGSQ